MKVRDFIEAERYFHKDRKEKKKEVTLKDFIKFQEDLKKFEEWQKSQKKDDNGDKKTWWDRQSVIQKTAYLFLGGHLLTLGYISVIMKAAAQMSGMK